VFVESWGDEESAGVTVMSTKETSANSINYCPTNSSVACIVIPISIFHRDRDLLNIGSTVEKGGAFFVNISTAFAGFNALSQLELQKYYN
jgi:hypothetical protein